MKEFWFMAAALILCGIVALCLICTGVGLKDAESIPPRTRDDGTLEPPPGFETTTTTTTGATA